MDKNLRVALVWNGTVYQERTFSGITSSVVTVGDSRSNDFIIPAEALPERFEMFRRQGSGYVLRFASSLEGRVSLGGVERSVSELTSASGVSKSDTAQAAGGSSVQIYEVSLSEADWGMLSLGEVTVFFQFVDRDDKVAYVAPWALLGLTVALTVTLFLSFMGHGIFLLIAELSYDPSANRAELEMPDRFVRFIAEEPPEALAEEEELEIPEEDTTGKKAGGEEGKFGDEDSDIPESKIPKSDGEMVDKVDVKNLGINKALGSQLLGKGPLSNVFGNVDGFDSKMNVAMSGEGNSLVIGRGNGGMGMRGTGTGGGGEGFGRVGGLGKVDTGGGKGVSAKIGGKGKAKVQAKVSRGAANVGQFCAKSNIQAVVGRGSSAIKYCYENELQQNPSLSGKVVLSWTVDLQGSVPKAFVAESTLKNSNVESCMVRVVKRWRFDPPQGGLCLIQYPFTFAGAQ